MMRSGLLFITLSLATFTAAQDIPLGTWRTHTSWTETTQLVDGGDKIFAAVESGIFYYDREDNSINRITTLDGLLGEGITALDYDNTRDILIVGYSTGNADLVLADEIINLDLTSESQVIGSKSINAILVAGAFAYLGTDYGILKLSLESGEVRETYRDIGPDGDQLSVTDLAFHTDSLFINTPVGVRATSIGENTNPGDWRFWVSHPMPVTPVQLASAGTSLFASVNNEGVFEYADGRWINSGITPLAEYRGLNGTAGRLVIAGGEQVQAYAVPGLTLEQEASDPLISLPNEGIVDDSGNWWIADNANGLLSDQSGFFAGYSPSGPASPYVFTMTGTGDSLFVLTGGYTSGIQPLNRNAGVHVFSRGEWTNRFGEEDEVNFRDITAVAVMPGTEARCYASAGDGLMRVLGDQVEVIDENSPGSPLENTDSPGRGLIIPDLAIGTDGIWMINYNASQPVHRLAPDGTWSSFSIPVGLARYAVQIELINDLVWLRVAPARGGGLVIFRPETGEARYLNQQAGSGSLPSASVYDMALDLDGFLWLGTAAGVSVITNPFVIEGDINAIEPVFEGRPLLIDEEVNAIYVDGGNRKWIGTDNGAWLFDPPADELLLRFTETGSPLPSDEIIDLEVDERTGEVFIGTSRGIVSYRSDATRAEPEHRDVRIFPNPVRPDFQGVVGISGLARDAEVKITDSSGRLVFRTQANGGTASWDVSARNLPGGMYMVFSATPDGQESFVGKIAVIR